MERKYRVAVVGGAGTWGRHYLRAYAAHPNCEIVALVDRARTRRQEFAAHYGIETVCDTLEELLSRQLPDIISLILPVESNPGAVIACARAGVKVVSCEKPIAVRLEQADEMVRVCRENGTSFGCGTAHWEVPAMLETIHWVREGNIGPLTGAAIPGGLPNEVSGAGCVQLTMTRLITGMEVEWVEGWTLPPLPEWQALEGVDEALIDCPAYGRLGLAGGILCEIPPPHRPTCPVALTAEGGQVWFGHPQPVIIQGTGPSSTPVYPDFLNLPHPDFFTAVVERLMRAWGAGGEAQCSGHDYRQALEIAIALKLSAQRNHQRVHLPLADRSHAIYPHPYRLFGGDATGWKVMGHTGPPLVTD